MKETTKYFVGVDLHKTILQVCVLDQDGDVIKERRIRGGSLEEGLAVVDWLTQWRDGGRVCVEASADREPDSSPTRDLPCGGTSRADLHEESS